MRGTCHRLMSSRGATWLFAARMRDGLRVRDYFSSRIRRPRTFVSANSPRKLVRCFPRARGCFGMHHAFPAVALPDPRGGIGHLLHGTPAAVAALGDALLHVVGEHGSGV